jgi:flagellar protein FliO/FliZ
LLVETLLTLVAVVAVAVVVLAAARRLGVGAPSGPMELVGRLPLDARRVIYLVRVGSQVLVVGGSEAGLVKLSEVPKGEILDGAPVQKSAFGAVLARALSPRGPIAEKPPAAAVPEAHEG